MIESTEPVTPYLLTDGFAVSFNAGADYWLDAAVLARQADGLQDQLDALSAYRGPLLPGFYDDWVTLEREHVEAVFQHKMQDPRSTIKFTQDYSAQNGTATARAFDTGCAHLISVVDA